jgi:hypothetical protein
LVLQSLSETQQEVGASFKAVDGVGRGDLQATGHDVDVELAQTGAVDLAGFLGIAAEGARLEHFETGDGEALAAAVDFARLLALVLPFCASAGIEQDGDKEEVDEAAGALLVVDGRGPRGHELVDARAAANLEVLPAAMGRDGGVVGGVVALAQG